MDTAHIHLLLNHVPVIGLLIGFFVLAWGALRKYHEVQTAGLSILFIASLVAIPVYLTGGPAGEIVERLPGVSEKVIELHEEAAIYSLVLCIVTGIVALLALLARHFLSDSIGMIATFAVLILTLPTGASIAFTANLGGQVRHTEIRQPQNGSTGGETRTTEKKKADDDDDN